MATSTSSRPARGGAAASGPCAYASSSHQDGRDGSGGFRLRGRIGRLYPGGSFSGGAGNLDGVRTMFTIYWLLILGGLVLWIGVGLVVE